MRASRHRPESAYIPVCVIDHSMINALPSPLLFPSCKSGGCVAAVSVSEGPHSSYTGVGCINQAIFRTRKDVSSSLYIYHVIFVYSLGFMEGKHNRLVTFFTQNLLRFLHSFQFRKHFRWSKHKLLTQVTPIVV